MAHYAQVEDGIVKNVIVVSDDDTSVLDLLEGTWIQTSYNTHGGVHSNGGTPLRKNFAGVGYVYDETLDAFYPPRPTPMHELDTETCLWQLKPEYADIRYVHAVEAGAVPTAPNSELTGALVLYRDAAQAGVYECVNGLFEFRDYEQYPVKAMDSQPEILYRFIDGQWVVQNLLDA